MIFNLVKNPTLLKSTLSSFPNRKNRKNRKKPVPNLIFSVVFGFFGLQPPPPPLKTPTPTFYRVFQKPLCKGFGLRLIVRPPVILSAKFFRESFRKVTHSRNTLRLANRRLFSNERSSFTFFVSLPWLYHIPFELLLFSL